MHLTPNVHSTFLNMSLSTTAGILSVATRAQWCWNHEFYLTDTFFSNTG
jgi:hypothetical protein